MWAVLRAAVAQSDNTASDLLLRRIGGPRALTRFFQRRGIESFRVDRYEYELQPQSVGLSEFIGQWIGLAAMMEAKEEVPVEAQPAAPSTYLADPRDRVTPADMVQIPPKQAKGPLRPPASTEKLTSNIAHTTTSPATPNDPT